MTNPAPIVPRKVFSTSRLAEFASISELEKQTGQAVAYWPLVVVKELVDNALDEAEDAGIAPTVEIECEGAQIIVTDTGRGIKPAVVKALVDFSAKTSSRAAIVAPTRGQQGNALQSIIAMGHALAPDADAAVIIESHGVAHTIRFAVDPVRQTPEIKRDQTPSSVKAGTRITVRWPDIAHKLINEAVGVLDLVEAYAWLNPHLTLDVKWGGDSWEWASTDEGWAKWLPSMPSSAHWYSADRLSRQMGSEIAYAQDHRSPCPSVRDFVGQFRGLKGTQVQAAIRNSVGYVERETLADYFTRPNAAGMLLDAMKAFSTPIKLGALGLIGEAHVRDRLAAEGCDAIVYRKAEVEDDGVPYVLEVGFGYRDDDEDLLVVEGFNFAPAIGGSPFRLEEKLAGLDVDEDDPVTVFAHLTSPRLAFLDKGKARLKLPPMVAAKLNEMVAAVTKAWTKQKRAEMRHDAARMRRADAMRRRDKPMAQTEAAVRVMVMAYMHASANGTLPANPRQIFYAARPEMLRLTEREKIDSKYFTQTLLPDYMNANPDETEDWNIAWDDRGHFAEPHTGKVIGLGTLAVQSYIKSLRGPQIEAASVSPARVATRGPKGRYAGVLYVEKEGFTAILEAARIAEQFDLAIASSKGMSVTACRMLVEDLCGRQGLPLFILHDFDKAGFSIRHTLFNTNRRYTFEHEIEPIDIGLRLTDIQAFARAGTPLQAEPVSIVVRRKTRSEAYDDEDGGPVVVESLAAARANLRQNGATEREIDYLLTPMAGMSGGRRVELNAMASDQFVAFVKRKLGQRLKKVVPAAETLAEVYAAFTRSARAKDALAAELARLNAEPVAAPADLERKVRAYLKRSPIATWDDAVRALLDDER